MSDNKISKWLREQIDSVVTKDEQIQSLQQQVDELREALQKAKQFIENGVEFGYITMPDKDTPDSAHDTLPAIIKALSNIKDK